LTYNIPLILDFAAKKLPVVMESNLIHSCL